MTSVEIYFIPVKFLIDATEAPQKEHFVMTK